VPARFKCPDSLLKVGQRSRVSKYRKRHTALCSAQQAATRTARRHAHRGYAHRGYAGRKTKQTQHKHREGKRGDLSVCFSAGNRGRFRTTPCDRNGVLRSGTQQYPRDLKHTRVARLGTLNERTSARRAKRDILYSIYETSGRGRGLASDAEVDA